MVVLFEHYDNVFQFGHVICRNTGTVLGVLSFNVIPCVYASSRKNEDNLSMKILSRICIQHFKG